MDGSDLGPLFATSPFEASRWLLGVLVLFAAPGVAILLWGLVTGRLSRTPAGLGLLAIPASVFVLANFYLLEASKDTRFCGSCHVMAPILKAALGGGKTLAARHIELGAIPRTEACYACHSDYGLWGTVQAKSSGVMHVVRNAFGLYGFPIQHNGPYPVSICLRCHAQAENFRKEDSHTDPDVQSGLLDGTFSCTGDCHNEAHPEEALNGPEGGKG